MKVLRLTLSLAVCVPGCALLGVLAAADRRFSARGGAVVGGLLGAIFGLAFGGALPRGVADYCFGAGGVGGEVKAAAKGGAGPAAVRSPPQATTGTPGPSTRHTRT